MGRVRAPWSDAGSALLAVSRGPRVVLPSYRGRGARAAPAAARTQTSPCRAPQQRLRDRLRIGTLRVVQEVAGHESAANLRSDMPAAHLGDVVGGRGVGRDRSSMRACSRVVADRQARRTDGLPRDATTGTAHADADAAHARDLFVPFHMEQEYARRVAEHGASALLVQRATRDYGHCAFTPTELVTAFVDLVGWVEGGVKPAGGQTCSIRRGCPADYG